MAIEVKVPDIGVDGVEVAEILIKIGDKVETERSLTTVEGGKVSMEVPSPQAGTVKEIKVSVSDKTQTSTLIVIFDSADGAADAAPTQAEEKREAAPAAAPTTAAAKDVNAPDIGSDEVEVTEILVKVGDKAEAERPLTTVEDDKTSMEVPAPFVGTVREIKASVGDKMSIGSLIMVSGVAGKAGAVAPMAKQEAAPAAAPAPAAGMREVNIPNVDGDEVEVTEVMVRVGDKVAAEQSLITIEGDKASVEVPAPFTGVVKELRVNIGNKVKTDSLIMIFKVESTTPTATPTKQEATTSAPATKAGAPAAAPVTKAEGKSEFAEDDTYVHATPLTRRLAREFGVSLTKMKGTGRKDHILREDVQAYVREAIKHAEAAPTAIGGGIPGVLPRPEVDFGKFGEIEEVELGRIQKISGVNLGRSWVVIPHVTHFDKTNITELEAFRKRQNEEAVKRKLDVRITPAVFIMKAVTVALEQVPHFNSSLSEGGQRLALKKYINISVAMDTPNGLVVPVFKDVNRKGIIELFCRLMTVSKKAHDGKLTAGEMQGGCFTVSSIGDLGIIHFASVVNAPEVAIPGVSKPVMGPVWSSKGFVPRLMLLISLSFDHCIIDGTGGARFITIISSTLSDIHRLVM